LLDEINSLELNGHVIERVGGIVRVGEYWKAQFAIDGQLYPPFFEHASHVEGLGQDALYRHLQAQSLTLIEG